jgi:glycerophosphoryl diester phosphodiesterase
MGIHPLLLGHRGARGEDFIPENTLASFDFALAAGCDGFEFDVRLSADGQGVICHDANTRGINIAQASAQQLALPLLCEVLNRYQGTAFLDIELKVAGLEAMAVELLRSLSPARGFVVSSFLPGVLDALHSIDTTIPLGVICETQAELSRWPQLPVEYVIPHHKLLDRERVDRMKSAGKKVLVWTVNLSGDMKRFSQWGVNGIISDHPEQLILALNRS